MVDQAVFMHDLKDYQMRRCCKWWCCSCFCCSKCCSRDDGNEITDQISNDLPLSVSNQETTQNSPESVKEHNEAGNNVQTIRTQQENIKPENECKDVPADTGHKNGYLEADMEVDETKSEKQNKDYELVYDEEPKKILPSKNSPQIFDSKKHDQVQQSQPEFEHYQADIKTQELEVEKELQTQLENYKKELDNQKEKMREFQEKEQHDKQENQKQTQEKLSAFYSKCQKEFQEFQDRLKDTQEKLEKCERELEECQKLQQDYKEEYRRKLIETQKELKICRDALTRHEEDSFKFTNAFTTADEGSVMKLKDVYRHMQQNNRTEAARAHRRLYKEATLRLADHGMIAYDKAKEIVFEAFTNHIDKTCDALWSHPDVSLLLSQEQTETAKHHNLLLVLKSMNLLEETNDDKHVSQKAKESAYQAFMDHVYKSLYQLQPEKSNTPLPQSDRIMKQCMSLIDSFHNIMFEDAKLKIEQTLISEYRKLTNDAPKDIPKQVVEYYSLLAKFAWDCVARTIPIVMSMEVTIYDEGIHDLKDKDEDEDYQGKEVTYEYPVLFTSNRWPREVAWKGRVKIIEPA